MTAEPTPSAGAGMNVDPTTLVAAGGIGRQLLVTLIAVLLGLVIGAILILLSSATSIEGFNPGLPIVAYQSLLDGSLLCAEGFQANSFACEEGGFLDVRAIGNTLNSATPLILVGLSVSFGFRAGLFNIGAQGQLFLGAFCAAVVGAGMVGVPFPLAMIVALLAGFLGGAAWGFIPGALKAWRGAHEVVTTIMLNFVAALLLKYLARAPFADPNATQPRTHDIEPAAALPILIPDTSLHAGIILALATAVLVWFLLFKTTLGFEIRTVGINPSAARYAGIRPAFITILTMSIAGGLAGLAGAGQILGITKYYPSEFSSTFGFDGIAVALLGRAHPFGVIAAGLLFGVLRAGSGTMQRETAIPVDIITIVQAVILLFVAADIVIRRLLPRARARRASPAAGAAAA